MTVTTPRTASRHPNLSMWLESRVEGPRAAYLGHLEGNAVLRLARGGVSLWCVTDDDLVRRNVRELYEQEPDHVKNRIALATHPGEVDPVSADTVLVLGLGSTDPRLRLLLAEATRIGKDSGVLLLAAPWGEPEPSSAGREAVVSRILNELEGQFAPVQLDLLEGGLGVVARPLQSDSARQDASGAPIEQRLAQEVLREIERLADMNGLVAEMSAGISLRDQVIADLDAELEAARQASADVDAELASAASARSELSKTREQHRLLKGAHDAREQELHTVQRALSEARSKASETAERLTQRDVQLGALRGELEALTTDMSKRESEHARTVVELAKLDTGTKTLRLVIEAAEERADELTRDMARVQQRLVQADVLSRGLETERDLLNSALARAHARVDATVRDLEDERARGIAVSRALDHARAELNQAAERDVERKLTLARLEERNQHLSKRAQEVTSEREGLRGDVVELQRLLSENAQEARASAALRDEVKSKLAQAEQRLSAAAGREVEQIELLASAKSETAGLRAEIQAAGENTRVLEERAESLRREVAENSTALHESRAREAELGARLEKVREASDLLTVRLQSADAARAKIEAAMSQAQEREESLTAQLADSEQAFRRLASEHEVVGGRLALRARQVETMQASRAYRFAAALWRLRRLVRLRRGPAKS